MFVSCNHDIDYDYGKYETDKYNAAFIKTFGQPASNQTWGFGSSTTTRAAQPNGNQWGTTDDNSKYLNYPQPKAITDAELQAVLNVFNQKGDESYTALIDWSEFFVQQVYKGVATYVAGNGETVVGSDKMNELACVSNWQQISYWPVEWEQTDTYYDDIVNNFNGGTNNSWDGCMLMWYSSTTDWSYKSSQSGGMRFHYWRMEKINGNYYVGFDFSAEGQNPNEQVKRDYIYNDWIVKVVPGTGVNPPSDELRIIAEDLSASDGSDFDFNDVVIDVNISGTTANCKLIAAGGTLPLRIGGLDALEIHKMFGVSTNVMVNTGAGVEKDPVTFTVEGVTNANQIKLEVYKNGEWIEMTANKGVAAAKIAVRQNFEYCRERVGISSKYPDFGNWVQDVDYIWW